MAAAPTRGVVFTEDVVKIAGQQSRYAVGQCLSPLGIFRVRLRDYLDPEKLYCRLRRVCVTDRRSGYFVQIRCKKLLS